ncbi:MAG: hypothetical protein V1706_12360 [Pseudomonadota bacterium]
MAGVCAGNVRNVRILPKQRVFCEFEFVFVLIEVLVCSGEGQREINTGTALIFTVVVVLDLKSMLGD